MLGTVMFVIFGYLSGSVLYARVFSRVFRKEGMLDRSRDRNPGTANAFLYGGFWCGFLTLLGDLLKGFVPVFLFMHADMPEDVSLFWYGLAIAAPVIGHAFPLFYGGKGGKGIAVSFGCLLGLLPMWRPVAALAVFFLFFSVVLRITPHYHRTLAAYLCAFFSVLYAAESRAVELGFLMIAGTVCAKLLTSKEVREKMGVKLLWMR